MKDKSYTLVKTIKPEIKKGDKIYLIDGSSLTAEESKKEHYIVYSYPELTGSHLNLKEIEATVIQAGIQDSLCMGVNDIIYLQDLIVKVGKGLFRIASGHVSRA